MEATALGLQAKRKRTDSKMKKKTFPFILLIFWYPSFLILFCSSPAPLHFRTSTSVICCASISAVPSYSVVYLFCYETGRKWKEEGEILGREESNRRKDRMDGIAVSFLLTLSSHQMWSHAKWIRRIFFSRFLLRKASLSFCCQLSFPLSILLPSPLP